MSIRIIDMNFFTRIPPFFRISIRGFTEFVNIGKFKLQLDKASFCIAKTQGGSQRKSSLYMLQRPNILIVGIQMLNKDGHFGVFLVAKAGKCFKVEVSRTNATLFELEGELFL